MAPSTELSRAAWRTSSYSNNGGNCVEVMAAKDAIGIRDTKDRAGIALAFGPEAWRRFSARLKD